MAQIKVLKIASDGIPLEAVQADDVTFNSFSVSGGAQVLSVTGLQLGDTPIIQLGDVEFSDPSTATINFTAGAGVIDDLMLKDRSNVMDVGSDILFPQVADSAGELDAFRLPSVTGTPSATPTNTAAGLLIYSQSTSSIFAWDGSSWDNLNTVQDANRVTNPYTAGEAIDIVKPVYISAADTVSLASASSTTKAQVIGLSSASAASGATVPVVSDGVLPGFSGLTPGARYYLDTTPGAITTTTPTGSGNTIVQLFFSKSATEAHLQIASLGRRS